MLLILFGAQLVGSRRASPALPEGADPGQTAGLDMEETLWRNYARFFGQFCEESFARLTQRDRFILEMTLVFFCKRLRQ